jgi:uncharacterized DUF497 family protein
MLQIYTKYVQIMICDLNGIITRIFQTYCVEIWPPHPVEDRGIIIGKYQEKIWTAIFTVRGDVIRIISVRRARKKEAKLYEKEKDGKKY